MNYQTHISNMYFYRNGNCVKCMYRHTQEMMAVATLDKDSRRITVQMSPTVSNGLMVRKDSKHPRVWNETIIQIPATGKKKKDLKAWNSFIEDDLYKHLASAICSHHGNKKCHQTQGHHVGNYMLIGVHDAHSDYVTYKVHLINGTRHSDVFSDEVYSIGKCLGKIIIDVVDVDITLRIYKDDALLLRGYRYGFHMVFGPQHHDVTYRLAIAPEQARDVNYFYSKEILVPYVEKFALTLKEMQRDDNTSVDSTATDVVADQNNITHVN